MNEAWLEIEDGSTSTSKYFASEAKYELRPGFTPSVGYVVMPVRVEMLGRLASFKKPQGPSTGSSVNAETPGTNTDWSVGAAAASGGLSNQNPQGVGTKEVTERTDESIPGQDIANFPNASELFRNEVSLCISSDITQDGSDRTDTIKIRRLRVTVIEPVEPPSLNRVVACKVYLQDRRIDWQKMFVMDGAINEYKGLDENGIRTFWPHSVLNSGSPIPNRRPMNLRETILHLLMLMGEMLPIVEAEAVTANPDASEVAGDRLDGYNWEASKDIFFGGVIENLGDTPEGVGTVGGSPLAALQELLSRFRLDLWLTHQSKVLIVRNSEKDSTIPKEAFAKVDSVLTYDNIYGKWSKNIVVMGPPVRVQEKFSMKSATVGATSSGSTEDERFAVGDFIYVIPVGGEWVPLEDALGKLNYPRAVRNGGDMTALEYVATMQVLSASGDEEKVVELIDAFSNGSGNLPVVPRRLRIVSAILTGAFKYIKILRGNTRQYVRRRMLPGLLSLNAGGNYNRPVIIADSWSHLRVRTYIDDPVNNYAGRLKRDAMETFDRNHFNEANILLDLVKVPNFPYEAAVVDPEQCVLRVDEPMVTPTGRMIAGGDIGKAVRMHTAFVFEPVQKMQLLVASELRKFSSSIRGGVPADHYSVLYKSESAEQAHISDIQPPLVIYRPEAQVDIVLADFNVEEAVIDEYHAPLHPSASPVVLARSGDLGGHALASVRAVDKLALDIAKRIDDSSIVENAIDVEYARVYTPVGVIGHDGELPDGSDEYQYTSYMKSIMWSANADGVTTTMRFGSDVSYVGDLQTSDFDRIAYMNQIVSENDIAMFRRILAGRMWVSGEDRFNSASSG